jgi:Zn-dependent M28 family amino/carboxypeptidase
MRHPLTRGRALVLVLVAVLLTGVIAPIASGAPPVGSSAELQTTLGFRKGVTVAGIREHQAAFQSFSDALGGNRVAGSAAYDASRDYVVERMEAAGYDVSLHEFTFLYNADATPPIFAQITPTPISYVDGVDFSSMTFSPNGDVTAAVTAVDLTLPPAATPSSTSGCEAADYAGFPVGTIALIQRGTCTFGEKAANAAAAGAAAVIVFNEGQPGRTARVDGTLGGEAAHTSPVIGTTFAIGEDLANGILSGPTGTTARVRVDRDFEERTTHNVIAETPGGDADRVVVIGAHLDSVSRGPGINDNGSGSGAILEIAEVFAEQGREPRNKLRFMWFGAEEFGLLGSDAYVDSLSAAERGQIEMMLNFDMVGSPNMVRFVYDGDNSAFPVGPGVQAGPPGSGEIERVFAAYFTALGLASEATPFSGRSDYGPFILATPGIPAGGLFTGAEGVKSAAQAVVYDGVAGEQFDPCYHLACDTFAGTGGGTIGGLGLIALDQMSDAAAHAVLLFSKRNFDQEPLTVPASSANLSLTQQSVGGATDAPSHAEDDRIDR